MNIDRLNSGLSRAGKSDPMEIIASPRKLDGKSDDRSEVKGSDSTFAQLVKPKAAERPRAVPKVRRNDERAPQSSSRDGSRIEVSPRISNENLSVKQDVDTGKPTEANESVERLEEHHPQAQENGKPKNLTAQQQAMLKFMDSMESEFGIPPARMVEAMTELSPKEMLQTPEDTASQVIQKLGLSPAESERAQSMYMSMVQKVSVLDHLVPKQMLDPTPQAAAWQQLSLVRSALMHRVMQEAQVAERQAELAGMNPQEKAALVNQRLDQLQQKFFVAPGAVLGEEGLAQQQIVADSNNLEALIRETQGMEAGMPQAAPHTTAAISQLMRTTPKMAAEDYQDMAAAHENAPILQQLEKLKHAFDVEPAVANGQTAQLLDQNGTLVKPTVQPWMTAAPEAVGGKSRFEDSSSGRDFGSSAGNGGGQGTLAGGELAAIDPKQAGLKDAAFSVNPANAGVPVVHSRSPEQNVQQVMNQAQYMIKKGGGEAIVRMNPEGLGEVHMRVSVADGKVNLQMSTATREAKDMLEGSMKDLKSSLGVHNLKVEHIKVDVGNQASADGGGMSRERGPDLNQGREQARQFLNNFSEENQANRGFFARPERSRVYSSAQGSVPKETSVAGVSARSRYVGEGRGTGLNLVA